MKKIIDNIELDGLDTNDYPDFADAYIISADCNGIPMTEEEINILNEDRDFVYQCVMKHFF